MRLSKDVMLRVVQLTDMVAEKFEYIHWEEIGRLTGLEEQISNYPRLFQSLYNGDDDYPACASNVLMMIAEEDEENIGLLEEYLVAKGFKQGVSGLNIAKGAGSARNSVELPVHSSVDRDYFKRLCFNGRNEFTKISCPYCNTGRLKVHEQSVNMVRDDEDPENSIELSFVFSLFLKCVDEKCHKCVSVGGKAYTESLQVHWDGTSEIFEYFYPKWFYPAINLFSLSGNCPDEVAGCIRNSFASFFNDPVAAGVHIRMSLERLMDHFEISAGNLHHRIVKFATIDKDLSNNLLALKWLGNNAGHEGRLSTDDVLDAYEIIEFVLEELFARKGKKESIDMRSLELTNKFDPKANK